MPVFRHATALDTARACGERILDLLKEAIHERGAARLAVSGGSSPRPMFEMFAATRFPWDRVQLFWVDERAVPPDDSQSNFRMVKEAWLKPADFPAANIHRVLAELDPHEAARRYHGEIMENFGLAPGGIPRFDVIHLGMGPDAHTASLFPGEPLIDDRSGITGAAYVEKFKQWRITLLPAVLLATRHTVMMAAGADKAGALESVLNGPYDPKRFPAQLVARNKAPFELFTDESAAARIA